AIILAYQATGGAENEARAIGREPALAYTLEAAIVHRKLGQHDEERAVLERWMTVAPKERREGSRVAERLAKLDAKSDQAQ
ncbi:hypothetical protein, partial [Citricoccus sp.]|uniref:hypothetical protein n=1 Tax=Citricoccus sp. TaxID=1978372 RepID=UPI0028BEC848